MQLPSPGGGLIPDPLTSPVQNNKRQEKDLVNQLINIQQYSHSFSFQGLKLYFSFKALTLKTLIAHDFSTVSYPPFSCLLTQHGAASQFIWAVLKPP